MITVYIYIYIYGYKYRIQRKEHVSKIKNQTELLV